MKGGYQVGTKIRLSDDEYLSEIVGSKDDLLQKGFEVRNFTYPYNANDERARNLVSDHYESGRSSGSLKGFLPGINVFPLNRLALYSKGIDNSSEEEVTAILNEIVEHNALGIDIFIVIEPPKDESNLS